MSRNTVYALVGLLVIAGGTLYWRYHQYRRSQATQREVAALMDRTEGNSEARIAALDSLLARYPKDNVIRHVATYQLLRAHVEAGSSPEVIGRAVKEFLAVDSSGAAYSYVSSVYADDQALSAADGLRYANLALAEAEKTKRPENMNGAQWAEQRRMMIGECQHIRGRLLTRANRLDEALTALRAAADSVPDSPSILLDLARVYERKDLPHEALETYMDVVRLRYDQPEARAAIVRLYPALYGPSISTSAVLDTLVANARHARRAAVLADTTHRAMPPFDLAGPGGQRFRSDELVGKIMVMDMWATWCEPCTRQMPLLQHAYERYGRQPGVAFLAVSFDQSPDVVAPFIERGHYTIPIAYGDRKLYESFKVQGIPTLCIIDHDGVIRYQHLGFSEVGDFVEELGWRIESLQVARPAS